MYIFRYRHNLCVCLSFLMLSLLASCEPEGIYADIDYGTLNYTVEANKSLSYYNQALRQTGLNNTLAQGGPYTLFATTDAAFTARGYTMAGLASTENRAWASQLTNYLLADGNYRLEDFPFGFNTPIRSRNGHYLYVSRWIPEAGDTVYTVNGEPLSRVSAGASNGILHVLSRIPVINSYASLYDRVSGTSALSLFAEAVNVSGTADLLQDSGPYTLFAPNNDAMRTYGYANIQAVQEGDPEVLADLVRRHVIANMYFRYDFRLSVHYGFNYTVATQLDYYNSATGLPATQTYNASAAIPYGEVTMLTLSGADIAIRHAYYNDTYDRLSLIRGGVTAITQVHQKDLVADNGVLHVVNAVLPE